MAGSSNLTLSALVCPHHGHDFEPTVRTWNDDDFDRPSARVRGYALHRVFPGTTRCWLRFVVNKAVLEDMEDVTHDEVTFEKSFFGVIGK
jgi:hypothetical protein